MGGWRAWLIGFFQLDAGDSANQLHLEWHPPSEAFVAYSIFGGVTQAAIDFTDSIGIGDVIDVDVTFTATSVFGTINGDYQEKNRNWQHCIANGSPYR